MNIAKKETPKDKLLFGIPTSMKLIYMVVYDMCKYNTHYTSIVIKIHRIFSIFQPLNITCLRINKKTGKI